MFIKIIILLRKKLQQKNEWTGFNDVRQIP